MTEEKQITPFEVMLVLGYATLMTLLFFFIPSKGLWAFMLVCLGAMALAYICSTTRR